MRLLSHLFSPIRIGKMELENRIVMSPMDVDQAMPGEGSVTDSMIAYYEARARGGVGLMITGHAFVDLRGRAMMAQTAIWDDGFIPGLARLSKAVHTHGGKI